MEKRWKTLESRKSSEFRWFCFGEKPGFNILVAPEKVPKLLSNNILFFKNDENICKVFCIFSHFLANILLPTRLMNPSLAFASIFVRSRRPFYAVYVSHFS
jgi:hypothetical protein